MTVILSQGFLLIMDFHICFILLLTASNYPFFAVDAYFMIVLNPIQKEAGFRGKLASQSQMICKPVSSTDTLYVGRITDDHADENDDDFDGCR